MIENIFFDCYQTLVDVDKKVKTKKGWEKFVKTLNEHTGGGIKVGDIISAVSAHKDTFYAHNDKIYYHHNLFDIVATVLKEDFALNLKKQTILELIYEYRKASRGRITIYQGIKDMLSDLSSTYTLALASYTQKSYTMPELKELGIEKYFSHCIFSSDIGFRKTSEKFYEECISVVKKSPNKCVMVGDNYDTDFLIPQKIGMKAIWIENPFIDFQSLPPSNEKPKNTVNLKEVSALKEIIEKIS